MAREKSSPLQLTVPSFFKCPITMDVMKSPVSLCTGVTYDRTSIQKWLDSGHNTCPATMQVLQSTDVVPNLTLRKLIRVWSDSYLAIPESNAAARFDNQVAFEKVRITLQKLNDSVDVDFELLLFIVEFVKLSKENCELVANLVEIVPCMMKLLRFCETNKLIDEIELVVILLDLILIQKGVLLQVIKFKICSFSPFGFVLENGNLEARIGAVRVLESLATFNIESRRLISEQICLNHFYRLISLETDQTAINAGLTALIAVCTSRQLKKEVVKLGFIKTAGKILTGVENSVSVIEKVMKVLEMLSTCTEGRTAISEDENCVSAVVQRLMKVSTPATEHGIGVIWSLCYMSRDRIAQEVAMRNNGLTKVLLVMQSNCSGMVRQMCGELVRVLRVNSKSCLASYETRTTHIMPY